MKTGHFTIHSRCTKLYTRKAVLHWCQSSDCSIISNNRAGKKEYWNYSKQD